MGRKNRVIKKPKQCTSSDSEDNITNIDTKDNTSDKDLHITWDTRIKMIEYCDEMLIPLCDYLSQDIMENFVKYLNES
jgi:hypothetical protein